MSNQTVAATGNSGVGNSGVGNSGVGNAGVGNVATGAQAAAKKKKTIIIIIVVVALILLIIIISVSVTSSQTEEQVQVDQCQREEGDPYYGNQYPCSGAKDPACPYRIWPPTSEDHWIEEDWGSAICISQWCGSEENSRYYPSDQFDWPCEGTINCAGTLEEKVWWDEEAAKDINYYKSWFNSPCPCTPGIPDGYGRICGDEGSQYFGINPPNDFNEKYHMLNGVEYEVKIVSGCCGGKDEYRGITTKDTKNGVLKCTPTGEGDLFYIYCVGSGPVFSYGDICYIYQKDESNQKKYWTNDVGKLLCFQPCQM